MNQGESFGFLSHVDTSGGHRGEEEHPLSHVSRQSLWLLRGDHRDAMRAGTPERSVLQWSRQELMEARNKVGKRVRCHTFVEDGADKMRRWIRCGVGGTSRSCPRFWPNQLQGGLFCLRRWGMLGRGAQFWTPTWHMPADHQEELVQGSQPAESEVQGRGPGLGGARVGEGRNYMRIVCLFVL